MDTFARSKRWTAQLARLGYATIGIVYIAIGVLALMGLFDMGGQFTGPGGVARTVRTLPFGQILLGIITLGLCLYVLWRAAQALVDVERRGADLHGLAARGGLLLSGLSYAGLAVVAGEWLLTGGGSVEDPKDDLTARLMTQPGGDVVAGLIGMAVIAVGLYQFMALYKAGFMRYVDQDLLSERGSAVLVTTGRVGLFARGVLFSILGGFVIAAALSQDANVKGLGGVLRMIGRQPYGHWLIGGMAVGLFVFGVFMLLKARYRYVMPVEKTPEFLNEDAAEKEENEAKMEQAEA